MSRLTDHAVCTVGLSPIGLAELDERAALMARVDRKYVLDRASVAQLLDELDPATRVLEIDGRRTFRYESVYFDTPTFEAYLAAARGRSQRFKVRTRTYVDTGGSYVELKTCDGRGATVKRRVEHPIDCRRSLTVAAKAFLAGDPHVGAVVTALRPVLHVAYERTTLLLPDGARATIDADLVCTEESGGDVRLRNRFIVETKSPRRSSSLDHLLHRLGHRHEPISKYATSLAALRADLPSNRWARTIRRHYRLRADAA